MKGKLFFMSLIFFGLFISCESCLAGYTGVKLFSLNMSNIGASITSSPTLTRMKISISGVYTVTGLQGYTDKYLYRSIWISDPIADDGTLLTINIPEGTQMRFDGRNFTVQKVKRIIKDGHAGTWAVMREFTNGGVGGGTVGDIGHSYSVNITFEADVASAITAGSRNFTFYVGYNEPFYSTVDPYDDILSRTNILSSTNISPVKAIIDVPGYCAESTFSSKELGIDHGSMNVANVNGNEKDTSITYECNTPNLPKVSFLGTSDSFVDVKLCDGIKSRLMQKTVSEGKYKFKTTFSSVLSRESSSDCSGAFSGSAVVSITYD